MPIIQHYEKLGLVKKIQAIKSPEQVRCCTCSFASMVNGAFEFTLQIDPYGSHIELNGFNEYYGMTKEHKHDPI